MVVEVAITVKGNLTVERLRLDAFRTFVHNIVSTGCDVVGTVFLCGNGKDASRDVNNAIGINGNVTKGKDLGTTGNGGGYLGLGCDR